MMINLTVDEQFTTISNLEIVQRQMKAFAENNTPQDILDAFLAAVPRARMCFTNVDLYPPKALACTGEAYSTDFSDERTTHYSLTLIVKDILKYIELEIKVDNNMEFVKDYGDDGNGNPINAYAVMVYDYKKERI